MKLITILLILVGFSTHSAVKEISQSDILDKIKNSALNVGITKESYLKSAHQFERLMGSKYSNLLSLESFEEYQNAMVYINASEDLPVELEEKLLQIINTQQQLLASALALDVSNLKEFLNVYPPQYLIAKSKIVRNEQTTAKTGKTETIIVRCSDDNCGRGSWGNGAFSLSLSIYRSASNIGVSPYESFSVSFRNQNTEETIKNETWRYNDFSGAWKVSNKPCFDCQVDY